MAHKKGDKVLVISGDDESGYIVTTDEVVTGGTVVKLKKETGEFSADGKGNNKRIIPMPHGLSQETSSSVFVKAARVVNKIGLSDKDLSKIMKG